MVDAPIVLRSFLIAQAVVSGLVEDRIWEQRNNPPDGYLPSQGQAICFRSRGGLGFNYTNGLYHVSWQFKCYGATEREAEEVYRVVADVLHDPLSKGISSPGIRSSALEVAGQPLAEPTLGWPYNLSYFETTLLANYVPA